MDLKNLLFGLLLFIIPLIIIILVYRVYIYNICHKNEQCIKKKLMYNLDDISNYLKNLVNKKEEEEQIEGFFSGIVDWFYPNPASVNDDSNSVEAANSASNTGSLTDDNIGSAPFPGDDIKDSNNNEFLKSLNDKSKKFNDFSNTKIKNLNDLDNLNKKLENEINNKVDDINSNKVENNKNTPVNFIEKNKKNDKIPLDYEINNPKVLYSPKEMEKEIPTNQKIIDKENFNQVNENLSNIISEEEQLRNTNNDDKNSILNNCNFFHDTCPTDYNDLGNFSISGMENNMTLNCGNVQNTKPAQAVAIIKNNEIHDIVITNKGQGFNPKNPPKIEVSGGGGRGASLESVINDDGYLSLIKVIHPGYNYKETPNIIIEGPLMNSSCHLCCKK